MLSLSSISNKFGPEQAFLVLISRVFVGTAKIEDVNHFISDSRLNWDNLFFIIRRQRIAPVAYSVLAKAKIDKDLIERLKVENTLVTFQCMQQTQEMLRVYRLIREKGINIIPYKGPVFAQQYYENNSLRQFSDIDILLPRQDINDLDIVINALETDGYKPMYRVPPGYRELLMKNTQEFYFDKYENGKRKYHIELHWLAHHPIFDLPGILPNEYLFKDTESIALSGNQIEVLNAQNSLLTLVMHHGVKENWASLKHIIDLSQIIKSNKINWQEVAVTSRKYKFNHALNIGLQIANDLLGIEVSNYTFQTVKTARFLNYIMGGKRQKHTLIYNQWQKINILDDNMARFRMLVKQAKYAFSPSILDYKLIALPKPFRFLYFFVKLVRIPLILSGKKRGTNSKQDPNG